MEKHKNQKANGFEGGTIFLENISQNPANALFRIEIKSEKKQFLQRLKELFTPTETVASIYLDRINAKHVSNYLHNHVIAADKVYKASNKDVTAAETPKMSAKKKTYKPRKPKTATSDKTVG